MDLKNTRRRSTRSATAEERGLRGREREEGEGEVSSGNEPAFDERSDEIDVAWSWKDEYDELVSSDYGKQLPSRVWDEREDGEGEVRRVQRLEERKGGNEVNKTTTNS